MTHTPVQPWRYGWSRVYWRTSFWETTHSAIRRGDTDPSSLLTGTEGLCMLLKWLPYPWRYSDLIHRFGRPVPALGMITNEVIDYIYNSHHYKITNWNNDILNPAALQMCANAISAKGAALDNCFRFIDGTVRPISKPGGRKRVMYNGHKRVHIGIKFQSIALPNGLIGSLYGPVCKKVR